MAKPDFVKADRDLWSKKALARCPWPVHGWAHPIRSKRSRPSSSKAPSALNASRSVWNIIESKCHRDARVVPHQCDHVSNSDVAEGVDRTLV
jgi:hypothetical protein